MRYLLAVAVLVAMSFSPDSRADVGDSEVTAIREQLLELSRRLDELERSNVVLRRTNAELREENSQAAKVTEKPGDHAIAASWAEKIKIKGDFRYRMENTDQDGNPERNRQRIQAHAAIIAKPQKDLELGLGLASGSSDPLSANQTIGNAGSSKAINLDLLYSRWSGLENTAITVGKFKNILHKSGGNKLLWDGDWNPEGFAVEWANGGWFANMLGTWLESDSIKRDTEFSWVLQGGFNNKFASGASLKAGMTYTDFGTRGKGSFFGGVDDFFGNSFDPLTNAYLYNYEELELFADLSFTFLDRPAVVFADYVQNQDAPEFDTGYAFGMQLGSAKSEGDWSLGWVYQDLEADAVLGVITDSDFSGGGTDGKGHILSGSFMLKNYLNASFTYFINETGENLRSKKDHDKLQLNLLFKY